MVITPRPASYISKHSAPDVAAGGSEWIAGSLRGEQMHRKWAGLQFLPSSTVLLPRSTRCMLKIMPDLFSGRHACPRLDGPGRRMGLVADAGVEE